MKFKCCKGGGWEEEGSIFMLHWPFCQGYKSGK